jgi:ribonuclease BN (tRNA processing enzyme)
VKPHNNGIQRQRQLNDFLYAELLHTLGSYRLSLEQFKGLKEELEAEKDQRDEERREEWSETAEALEEACARAVKCNTGLHNDLHRPDFPRHPAPEAHGKERFSPDTFLLESIAEFYDAVIAALKYEAPPSGGDRSRARLGELLAVIHDPQRRGGARAEDEAALRPGRIARMEDRRRQVEQLLLPKSRKHNPLRLSPPPKAYKDLFESEIEMKVGGLAETILKAMSQAHRWMHEAEHRRRKDFGPMLEEFAESYGETQKMLRYAHALNTFAFVAAKIAPWAFAEDEAERKLLTDDVESFRRNCNRLTPTYCLWAATQVSLLALHRRAFTSLTGGRHAEAYRDFHKLSRLLRVLSAPAERRAVRVPGTKTFIEGMTAMTELHIGRIYRGQHAHRMALKYFKRSFRHLDGWEEHEEIGEIITNSQWRINGLLNRAKAHYELGAIAQSLLYYAYAWRAFLCLADSESHATANVDVVEGFIEWLEPLAEEPELSRIELRNRLEPLVEQFDALRSPRHLERLAADIVMRIGHLLYILKLPRAGDSPKLTKSPKSDHELARICIVKASQLDPTNTLIASDLLKIKASGVDLPEDLREPLDVQWPSGGGRFEESARVVEYVLHRWLASLSEPDTAEAHVARELMESFLAHTDSSNVKLAQVYRYMMEGPGARQRPADSNQRTLDVVCLRRYSSFYPFLPRPTSFRALGGGYFVHAREPGEKSVPLGIAIDPGPDFIENLYRCGYSLSDIHMIVITHDHSDHIASLDALLTLLRYRDGLGEPTFDIDGKRLAVIGNPSVVERYEFFNRLDDEAAEKERETGEEQRREAIRIFSFEQIVDLIEKDPKAREEDEGAGEFIHEILARVPTLEIEPVLSWNHFDAARSPSQAFLLSVGTEDERSTVLFTGDTGLPPKADDGRFASGAKTLLDAVEEADVVVAHLSGVPLRELREVAGLVNGESEPDEVGEFEKLWQDAVGQAKPPVEPDDPDRKRGNDKAEFLLRQLQFGFRSRPEDGRSGLGVSPLSPPEKIRRQPRQHLYLSGLLEIAKRMRKRPPGESPPLLVIGEMREDLGTFRTRIAALISSLIFKKKHDRPDRPAALTADIGLRVRLAHTVDPGEDETEPPIGDKAQEITVLCTTCDLDNDLVPSERFHPPHRVLEVCVKGEDEGVFYNCLMHHPRRRPEDAWLEAVERYNPFGE